MWYDKVYLWFCFNERYFICIIRILRVQKLLTGVKFFEDILQAELKYNIKHIPLHLHTVQKTWNTDHRHFYGYKITLATKLDRRHSDTRQMTDVGIYTHISLLTFKVNDYYMIERGILNTKKNNLNFILINYQRPFVRTLIQTNDSCFQ